MNDHSANIVHPFLEQLADNEDTSCLGASTKKKFDVRKDFTLASPFEQLVELGLPDLICKVYRHWQHSPL